MYHSIVYEQGITFLQESLLLFKEKVDKDLFKDKKSLCKYVEGIGKGLTYYLEENFCRIP